MRCSEEEEGNDDGDSDDDDDDEQDGDEDARVCKAFLISPDRAKYTHSYPCSRQLNTQY